MWLIIIQIEYTYGENHNITKVYSSEGICPFTISTLGGDNFDIVTWAGKDFTNINDIILAEYPEFADSSSEFSLLFEGIDEPFEDITSLELAKLIYEKKVDITKPILVVWK